MRQIIRIIRTNTKPLPGAGVSGWLGCREIQTSPVLEIIREDETGFLVRTDSGSIYLVQVNPGEKRTWAQRLAVARSFALDKNQL